MNIRWLSIASLLTLSFALAACRSDDDPSTDTGDGDGDGDLAGVPCDPADPSDVAIDESSCGPAPTDYLPLDSDNDMYPACISDGGVYELVGDTPGSAARIIAFDQIAGLLWENGAPNPDDFTDARAAYELDEGLGSRLDRREDLHYPAIPMAEWNSGLDPDKQCSDDSIAANHPDRCVGPVTMRPLINSAFIAGMSGDGDPNVHAARIEATLMWFVYLSVYKEANTCLDKDKDCDSLWAYYTSGTQVDGDVLGMAEFVKRYSATSHQRIFDGLLAVRCWRDLYPIADYPTYADVPADGQALYDTAWEQLDDALARGFAIVVREHVLAQDDDQCAEATEANWAFVQIAGLALDREVRERDANAADELLGIYALEAPASEDLARVAELIDEVIPCG